jgi:hypothetical protein
VLSFLNPFNKSGGEYTEGATKKHRPKERCPALDNYVTIKMRKSAISKGYYKSNFTICEFPPRDPSSTEKSAANW